MATTRYSLIEYLLFPPTRLSMLALGKRLAGKNVLITGASYGIGEALACLLAPTGAQLLLVARTAHKLDVVAGAVKQRGGNARAFPADLTNPADVQALVNSLAQLPGGIDIVVSNAGHSIHRSLHDSIDRLHDFSRSMGVNYFGPLQLLLGLVPLLRQSRGHIINVSAINVLLAPAPHWAAYQSSKTAFDQWFRCAVPELNAAGVGTTSVYLPLVRTRMIEPTAAYQKMPAMQPAHAARKICRAICTRSRMIAPWWLIFGQLGSVLFRRPFEYFAARLLKSQPYAQ